MSPFETILLEELAKLKEKLRVDESLSGFELTIRAEGRLDGDLEVSFELGDRYGLGSVKCGSIAAAREEFLRRRGWSARHAPLCLPNVGASKEPDAGSMYELVREQKAGDL